MQGLPSEKCLEKMGSINISVAYATLLGFLMKAFRGKSIILPYYYSFLYGLHTKVEGFKIPLTTDSLQAFLRDIDFATVKLILIQNMF